MDSKPISEQVEWNMAQALSMELARLREQSNRAFCNRNIPGACESLICARLTSTHVFSAEELIKLKEIEQSLLNLIGLTQKEQQGFGTAVFQKEKALANLKLYKTYMEYNDLLQTLLDNYGFLGGRKKDATKVNF